MTKSELVSKIAYLRKISSTFVDFRGTEAETPIENIELILQAMGFNLDDLAQLEKDAFDLDTHQWKILLEPITILSPLREQWGINLFLTHFDLEQSSAWKVTTESGEQINGDFKPAEIEQTGDYWLDGTQYLRRLLNLPTDLPLGYHTIEITVGERKMASQLVVTPKTCYHNAPMRNGSKIWGTAIQLYTLRSEQNWGMGDFGDLMSLIEQMAEQGADVIGLNPIHSLYPINPGHCSPYSPSNRSFLNVLYIDVAAVPEVKDSPALARKLATKTFSEQIAQLQAADNVDYAGVSALKFECFEMLYSAFKKKHLNKKTPRDDAYQTFLSDHGEPLRQHALFEAMLAHFKALDSNAWGWPVWPTAYQDPSSPEVAAFAEEHADEVEYWTYLQFLADEQLQAADRLSKRLGMKIGLYRDLAVGADRGGAEVWANKTNYCLAAATGAPPDALGPNGQNWGLPPLDPVKLKNRGYQAFITLLRNNMRACGALRIDHALALLRLWWCPPGKTAAYGAYVYYDMFDLLGLLNLESVRNECMVIAEDLGTVPQEVMTYFPQAELYSNKVFYFEMNDGGCTEPEDYPEKALAIVCNHDMPTVKAFWESKDLALRSSLSLIADDELHSERQGREYFKRQILALLARHGRLPDSMTEDPDDSKEMTQDLNFAIHYQLAATRSQIIAVQLEDLMLIESPVNIPGTSSEYPNWRRKLPITTKNLFADDEIQAFCRKVTEIRGYA